MTSPHGAVETVRRMLREGARLDGDADPALWTHAEAALQSLEEQLQAAQREARANLTRWERSERRNERLAEQLEALGSGETGAQPTAGTTRATCDLGPDATTDSPQVSSPAKNPKEER